MGRPKKIVTGKKVGDEAVAAGLATKSEDNELIPTEKKSVSRVESNAKWYKSKKEKVANQMEESVSQ
jgi:hypothetical protein